MGWIESNDRMPPEGLQVLVEASGEGFEEGTRVSADHSFFLASWIVPNGENNGNWVLDSSSDLYSVTVHAWMPLPKHHQPKEFFEQEDDLMEHAMFEDDPDWLYKDDAVYEQMSIVELLS